MSLTKKWAILAASAVAGAGAFAGCSSSNHEFGPRRTMLAATSSSSFTRSTRGTPPGTTAAVARRPAGRPCSTAPRGSRAPWTATRRSTGGPGINKCSTAYEWTVTGIKVQLWPTPVCLTPLPTGGTNSFNCDPAPSWDPMGAVIHTCDAPDVQNSGPLGQACASRVRPAPRSRCRGSASRSAPSRTMVRRPRGAPARTSACRTRGR